MRSSGLGLSVIVTFISGLAFTVTADHNVTACGDGQCVNGTSCCPGERECCDHVQLCCGEHCCQTGYECCHGSPRCCGSAESCCGDELCCPENTHCCPNMNHCCSHGYTCCDESGGCCPEHTQCCGNYCCAENMLCCPNGTGCYRPGYHCCGEGLSCPEGHQCCGAHCCGPGAQCCDGQCCLPETSSTTDVYEHKDNFPENDVTVRTTTKNTEGHGPSQRPITNPLQQTRTSTETTDWSYIVFPVAAILIVIVLLVACFILAGRCGSYSPSGTSHGFVGYVWKIRTLLTRTTEK